MTERATITATAEAVLALADQLTADALRAASVQDWRTASDGLTDAIRDLCSAARHLPGHGEDLNDGFRFLLWNDDADGFGLGPLVRDALRGDHRLARGLVSDLAESTDR